MQLCDSVDFVTADDAQIGHYDSFGCRFFNNGKHVHFMSIVRVSFADFVHPEEIDEINQLKMSG